MKAANDLILEAKIRGLDVDLVEAIGGGASTFDQICKRVPQTKRWAIHRRLRKLQNKGVVHKRHRQWNILSPEVTEHIEKTKCLHCGAQTWITAEGILFWHRNAQVKGECRASGNRRRD